MPLPEIDDEDTIAAPQMVAPRRDWCHPSDEDHQRWIITFDDSEMGITEYEDEGEARKAFAELEMNWNCHLFTSVSRVPTQPVQYDEDDVALLVTNVKVLTTRVAALEDRMDDAEDGSEGEEDDD